MACGLVTLPRFLTVRMMSGRSLPRPNLRNGKIRKHGQSSPGLNSSASTVKIDTSGFGNKKREPQWQCVKNCGACCKLDKGPTFPSPEEVFDDESDVEVSFYFFTIWMSFIRCFARLFMSMAFSFSTIEAWLDQMGGAYTSIKLKESVPFMLVG